MIDYSSKFLQKHVHRIFRQKVMWNYKESANYVEIMLKYEIINKQNVFHNEFIEKNLYFTHAVEKFMYQY